MLGLEVTNQSRYNDYKCVVGGTLKAEDSVKKRMALAMHFCKQKLWCAPLVPRTMLGPVFTNLEAQQHAT